METEEKESLVKRQKILIRPNRKRVICRFHNFGGEEQIRKIIQRVLSLPETQVDAALSKLMTDFEHRHRRYREILMENYHKIASLVPDPDAMSVNRKLLLGAYFSMEYSIEAAALFNPSIVPYPGQGCSGQTGEACRFILSLRATGEGHISSIEFTGGVINESGEITLDPISSYASTAHKIKPLGNNGDAAELTFDSAFPISERVVFPVTEDESNGIEDVRFVRFTNDGGEQIYYGTYTAYDGKKIASKLIETADFVTFKLHTLHGNAVRDKGMALFPRKINGKYAMISRQDNENIRLMYSENILEWQESQIIQAPEQPWEFIKLGNCGSPIATEAGWLLLMHGVGAMRQYAIGVYLLDLNDPSKIIGRLDEPLLSPTEKEREGYVPNVVYSCGGMVHNEQLIIPYAMSDYANSFAVVDLNTLLSELTS